MCSVNSGEGLGFTSLLEPACRGAQHLRGWAGGYPGPMLHGWRPSRPLHRGQCSVSSLGMLHGQRFAEHILQQGFGSGMGTSSAQ